MRKPSLLEEKGENPMKDAERKWDREKEGQDRKRSVKERIFNSI